MWRDFIRKDYCSRENTSTSVFARITEPNSEQCFVLERGAGLQDFGGGPMVGASRQQNWGTLVGSLSL